MPRWPSILLALFAVPVTAQPGSVVGTWCEAGGGEILFLEENGIGFNEHTICDVDEPVSGTKFTAMIACRNVYFVDGEAVEVFQEDLNFDAELVAGMLQVTLRNDSDVREFSRCE